MKEMTRFFPRYKQIQVVFWLLVELPVSWVSKHRFFGSCLAASSASVLALKSPCWDTASMLLQKEILVHSRPWAHMF